MGSTSVDGSEEIDMHSQLYKASFVGDWKTAKSIFEKDINATTAGISFCSGTALHVAVLSGKANDFVRKLVDMLPIDKLTIQDSFGDTALHHAAKGGNTEAAKTLVSRNPKLLYIFNWSGRNPVLQAALYGRKETLEYLRSISSPYVEHSLFQGESGTNLLVYVISSQFFDVALDLVDKYPHLARLKCENGNTALSTMAGMATVFLSGQRFSWWQKWIYDRVPIKQHKMEDVDDHESNTSLVGDIENPFSEDPMYNKRIFPGVSEKLEVMLWNIIQRLVPCVEDLRDKKVMHQQTRRLVKRLCQKMLALPQSQATNMFWTAITRAAMHGISEIVEVVIDKYPMATYATDGESNSIFHLAAKYRFENVFNLLHSQSYQNYEFFLSVNNNEDNLMHICGKQAPPDRLNLVPGAALQMQREIQWYKEMEKLVHYSHRIWPNKQMKTPKMLFTEEHHQLKVDGERWMKDTANAYSISAALIATAMFSAIFTVPGGFDKGIPLFSTNGVFILFAITDTVSLFTSITSLLMFLSIFTSRYAEKDFLYVLPKRLCIGLLNLFISVTFMMIAFTSALYFVFHTDGEWFIIPVIALACLPVTSFVLLQFPLLVEVAEATYGPGIFAKKYHITVPPTKLL